MTNKGRAELAGGSSEKRPYIAWRRWLPKAGTCPAKQMPARVCREQGASQAQEQLQQQTASRSVSLLQETDSGDTEPGQISSMLANSDKCSPSPLEKLQSTLCPNFLDEANGRGSSAGEAIEVESQTSHEQVQCRIATRSVTASQKQTLLEAGTAAQQPSAGDQASNAAQVNCTAGGGAGGPHNRSNFMPGSLDESKYDFSRNNCNWRATAIGAKAQRERKQLRSWETGTAPSQVSPKWKTPLRHIPHCTKQPRS